MRLLYQGRNPFMIVAIIWVEKGGTLDEASLPRKELLYMAWHGCILVCGVCMYGCVETV